MTRTAHKYNPKKLNRSKCRPAHSYSNSMHTICLSCSVWPQYTTRQTGIQAERLARPNRNGMIWIIKFFFSPAFYYIDNTSRLYLAIPPRFGKNEEQLCGNH